MVSGTPSWLPVKFFRRRKLGEKVMDSGRRGSGLDRLGNLHDSILCHILSFLPTKNAVGTSVLASRWRYLWVYSPNLIFEDHDFSAKGGGMSCEKREELHITFANFVNRVLHFIEPLQKPLQKFTLCCTFDDYLYLDIGVLHSWIDSAISCNVQSMRIFIRLGDPIVFPLSIYTCKTLVNLTLEDGFLPFPASVWLPSLKFLNLLEVLYENDETAHELYSGCPVLERLRIERQNWRDNRTRLNVTSPTLKWLHLDNYMHELPNFPNAEEPIHLYVNAPNMTYLYLEDNVSDDFTLSNLSSLLEASVSVFKACQTPARLSRYLCNLHKLVSGIAHVKTLNLSLFYDSTPSFPFNWSYYAVPMLNKLTKLRFHANGAAGWNSLMCFLHSSPMLRFLEIVSVLQMSDDDSFEFWSKRNQVPECLVLCLEEIDIAGYFGEECELEGVEYLLKHAKKLRKMKIHCRPAICKEVVVHLREKLASFPRGSGACWLMLIP